MNRAGSPEGGRKKTSAKGSTKATTNSDSAKAAKASKPAAKPASKPAAKAAGVKTALGKAGRAASGFAQKIAKSVTSITKSNLAKAQAKAQPKPEPKSAAKPVAKAVAKPAAKSSMKNAVTSAAGAVSKASAAVKSLLGKPKASAKPAAKAAVKPTAKAAPAKGNTKEAPAKSAKAAAPAKKIPAAKNTASKTAPAKSASQAPAKTLKPSRTLRPKSFGKLETARGFGFPEQTPELPESYGEDRLVLMTKDPEYLFAYWEITPERRAQGERAKHAGVDYREALRLNWTSGDLLEDSFALVPVSLDAKRWYVRVPFSGLSYYIEIGWLSEQGHFISLLESSNASDAPESWAKTRERLGVNATTLMEYSLSTTQPLGSSETARPVASVAKRAPSTWNYEGPGAQSSSDAAIKIPAAAQAGQKRS